MSYEMPPEELAAIVDAPLTPSFSIDPTRTVLLLMHRPGAPSIEEVSRSELRLAGLRLDPDVNGQRRGGVLQWVDAEVGCQWSRIACDGVAEGCENWTGVLGARWAMVCFFGDGR